MFETVIFYNFIFVFSTIFAFFADRANFKFRPVFNLLLFFILLLPMAFRFNIGTDYSTYNEIFNDAEYDINYHSVEFLYFQLNKFISFLGFDFDVFVFLISSIVILFFCFSLNGRNRFVFISFFVLINYFYYFSNIRTSLVHAILIFFIFRYYLKWDIICWRRRAIFICVVLFLSLIHYSAILFLSFIFIDNKFVRYLLSKKFVFLLLFLSFSLLVYYGDFFVLYFVNLLGYGNYLDSLYFSTGDNVGTGFGIFLKIIPAIYFIFMFREVFDRNKRYVIVSFSMMIYVVFTFLSLRYSIASRIAVLFSFSYPLAMFLIFEISSNFRKKIFFLMFFVFWVAVFEKSILDGRSDKCRGIRIAPYVSIFNKDSDRSLGVVTAICYKYE